MDLDRIRAVCWDWNGTLLDDTEICRQVMNSVLEEHALPALADEHAYRSVFRFPIRDFYGAVGLGDDLFVPAATSYLELLAARVGEARLHAEASATLGALQAYGIRQVLASATLPQALALQMEPHDLDAVFEQVLSIDDPYRASKHEVIRAWLAASGLTADEVLVIGDTNHDREIAHDLGTAFVHFDGGHQAWSGDTPRIQALGELVGLLTPLRAGVGSVETD
ncbi:HAD family hydrolase [Microbacterium sp. NPDC028030]|uniref:HAD family hydrolase n=1 Tax=Microbacterium sp. NPDC028030 TaxID=3155124 RepID=UPI0033CC12FF